MNAFLEDVILNTDFWVSGPRRYYCGRDWGWDGHVLDDYDLWYVAGGIGRVQINDCAYDLREGRLFIFAPDDVVSARQRLPHNLTVYYCHFSTGRKTTLFNVCARLPRELRDDDGRLRALFEEALDREERSAGRKLARRIFLLRLLEQLAEHDAIGLRSAVPAAQSGYVTLRKLTGFVEKNVSRRILLADLARSANSNRTTVTRLFTRYLRQTPHQYINRLKIERAREMLARGAAIKEAAHRLGFADVYTFSKLFKKIEKCTPGQYLRQMRPS